MQRKIASFLLKTSNEAKSVYIWNSVSTILNSFQTMILLFALTHTGTDTDSGIFVMAYAVGNLVLHIGKYGMRQFQVTDIQEKHLWQEYKTSRIFSCCMLMMASLAYTGYGLYWNGYSSDKAMIILLICFYKGIEAAEDVFHGRMQQKGRLDVAAKILTVRFSIFIFGYAGIFILTKNLLVTTVVNVSVTFILCILLNSAVWPAFAEKRQTKCSFPWKLMAECLPLCLSMVLSMYIGNAPKYIIDGAVDDLVMTRFNVVFMPAFVVSMLSNFIFNPSIKKIGELWTGGNVDGLKRMIIRLTMIPVALTIVIVIGGAWLGVPVLGWIYATDLSEYRLILMIFLLASGMIAVINLYIILLTAMRRQGHILGVYAIGTVVLAFGGRWMLKTSGLTALCWLYLAVLVAIAAACVVMSFVVLHGRPDMKTLNPQE